MENTVGRKGLIKKHELIRIIIQCLHSLGYRESATCLESESNIHCKSTEFESLESHIQNGNWDDCLKFLSKINGLSDETRASALFIVLEHYLLECMQCRDVQLALGVLQKKIALWLIGEENVRKLCFEMISVKDLDRSCGDRGVVSELRKGLVSRLEKVLPPPITLPERRLECLVEMAVCGQIDGCVYHSSDDVMSLYRDHHCSRDQFPTETIQILSDHRDEVWFVQFSNNGEYLASSSSDFTAIIWKVHDDNKVTPKHRLNSHKKPISFVAWSPDDTMLLTCGNMEVVRLWDVETGICKQTFGDESFIVSSCAWFPNSKSIFCGSSDPKKGIHQWDCDGKEIRAWKGTRMPKVLDLAVTPDGENLICIFADKEIRIWNLSTGMNGLTNAEHVISEEHSITSLSVSGDGKFLIVNLNSQEIHMWDVAGKWLKPLQYKGHVQKQYVIRSCFGGLNSMFIASGSEDSKVYIWNRCYHTPIEILSGHKKTVNCVSWNPRRPQILASASDDCKIRIWGPSCSK